MFFYKDYYHIRDLEDCKLGIKLKVFKAAGEVLEQKNSNQFYRLSDCAIGELRISGRAVAQTSTF